MKSDLVDIAVRLHAVTDRAVKVSLLGVRADAVWVPLSHADVTRRPGGNAEIAMPEWLALEKGLI